VEWGALPLAAAAKAIAGFGDFDDSNPKKK